MKHIIIQECPKLKLQMICYKNANSLSSRVTSIQERHLKVSSDTQIIIVLITHLWAPFKFPNSSLKSVSFQTLLSSHFWMLPYQHHQYHWLLEKTNLKQLRLMRKRLEPEIQGQVLGLTKNIQGLGFWGTQSDIWNIWMDLKGCLWPKHWGFEFGETLIR